MTRCCRNNINLKSSVYNQTGQTYLDQLALHRLMCSHLRRVLLAKSVVDTRNPRYMRALQRRCQPSSCKFKSYPSGCPSNETIDKLAYDTEHHPADIAIQRCKEHRQKERNFIRENQRIRNKDINCACSQLSTERSRLRHQENPRSVDYCDCRSQHLTKERHYTKMQYAKSNCQYSRTRSCKTTTDFDSESSTPERLSPIREISRRTSEVEESQYAKFVYDITQEIVQNGLYTDRELKEVFAKHIEKNSGQLSKRKMLYEIYQLKISLGIIDDSEEEDEVEVDLVYAEKFSNTRVPKPPTPPKVLNENKLLEKLESFKRCDNNEQQPSGYTSPGVKNVMLVDANPEFLVTEKDVLTILMDNNINPKQIQRIYKKLSERSKDMSFCEAVQVGKEVAYTHRLKKIGRSDSALSLSSSYPTKTHGILRKESTDFAVKVASPDKRAQRLSIVGDVQNAAKEKCETWKNNQCHCNIQSTDKTVTNVPVKKQSLVRISVVGDSPVRTDETTTKKKNKIQEKQIKKIEKTSKEITKSESKYLSTSPEKSSSALEVTISEGKVKPVKKKEMETELNEKSNASYVSEENEEIEEEIESVIDELPDKSSKQSSSPEYLDKSDHEEKELSSVPELPENEPVSIASDITDDSAKYSDDFSNVSESSSKDDRDKSKVRSSIRFSTVQEYFVAQRFHRASGASSDTSSTTGTTTSSSSVTDPTKLRTDRSGYQRLGTVIKKRTSSATFGFKPWSDQTEASADIYAANKLCETKCRTDGLNCSDACRFSKSNCKRLPDPGSCLTGGNVSDSSETSTTW